MRFSIILLAGALVTLPVSCVRRPATEAEPAATTPRTMLRVENQAFLDMNVYVVYRGSRRRVGTANGASVTNFELPMRLTTMESLSFIADPIGGRANTTSMEIMVTPGDVITLRIPPQ